MKELLLPSSEEIREIIREEVTNGIKEYALSLQLEKRINSKQLYDHFQVSRPTGIRLKRHLIKTDQLNPLVSDTGKEYFLLSEVVNINPKYATRELRKLRRSLTKNVK